MKVYILLGGNRNGDLSILGVYQFKLMAKAHMLTYLGAAGLNTRFNEPVFYNNHNYVRLEVHTVK